MFFPLTLSSDLLQVVAFLPEPSLSIFPTSNFLLGNACSRRLEADFGLQSVHHGTLSVHDILHDDMNGITSAVWLTLVVAPMALGAHCSRNVGH